MADALATTPRCHVCAQPAEKLKCSKCKTPYCSVACQVLDWKERGHKATCKRLVKEAAARDEAAADLRQGDPLEREQQFLKEVEAASHALVAARFHANVVPTLRCISQH